MHKIGRIFLFVMMGLVAAAAARGQVSAQETETPQLKLSMSRDWGYGGLGGEIQGLFTLKIKDTDALTRVIFYMDDTVLYEDDAPPFKFQFRTDDYPPGAHVLWAQGYTADGAALESNRISVLYLTKEEANAKTRKLLFPILGAVLLAMLLSVLLGGVLGRREKQMPPGSPRRYGLWGGAICPHCGRPYAMHFYGLNLLTRRLDHCPYCGRWALVKRQPLEVLREAERAELAQPETPPPADDEAARLKKLLDDSRFEE